MSDAEARDNSFVRLWRGGWIRLHRSWQSVSWSLTVTVSLSWYSHTVATLVLCLSVCLSVCLSLFLSGTQSTWSKIQLHVWSYLFTERKHTHRSIPEFCFTPPVTAQTECSKNTHWQMLQSGIWGTGSRNRGSTYTENPLPVWLFRVKYQESQIGTGGQNIHEKAIA